MQRKNFIRRETKQTNGLLWECDDEGRVFSYCKNGESIESMTNLNQQLSSFYNAKACREDRKHIEDRKNENKPTKSFETVNEGFYQGEEEEKRIEDEFLDGGTPIMFLTMTVVGRTFMVQLKF